MAIPRKKRFYLRRLLFVCACGLVVFLAFLSSFAKPDSDTAGLVLFKTLSVLVMAVVWFGAPFYGAYTMLQERQNRIHILLFLSELTPAQIVVAKLASAMIVSFSALLASSPLFILCTSLGGIGSKQILTAFVLLAGVIIMGNGMGLLIATMASNEAKLTTAVFKVMVCFYLLVPAAAGIGASMTGMDGERIASYFAPMMALLAIVGSDDMAPALICCGVQVLAGLVFIGAAAMRLESYIIREDRASRRSGWMSLSAKRMEGIRTASTRKGTRTRLLSNPVFWRDFYLLYGGTTLNWVRFLVVNLVILGVTVAILVLGMKEDDPMAIGYALCFVMTATSSLLALGSYTFTASRMFNRERPDGTIEILMCTDLHESDIINAKVKAVYATLTPWMTGVAIGLVGALAIQPSLKGIILVLIVAAMISLTAYAYTGIVMYLAARIERNAEWISLGILIGWLTVGLPLLSLFSILLAFAGALGPAIFIGGPLAIGVIFRGKLHRDFRKIVFQRVA